MNLATCSNAFIGAGFGGKCSFPELGDLARVVRTSRQERDRRERRVFVIVLVVCALLSFLVFAGIDGPAYVAYWNDSPREGDILFQSLP